MDQIALAIREGLKWLGTGDAATTMGAVEFHAVCVKEAGQAIAEALDNVASAIREAREA